MSGGCAPAPIVLPTARESARATKTTVSTGRAAAGKSGIFDELDGAVEAASRAQAEWVKQTLEQRAAVIAAMRKAALDNLDALAMRAVAETGLGRVEDKVAKNRLAATKTPGIEILRPAHVQSGDDGLTLEEYAPFGVIGSVTPTTNPTETIINNGISIIAGGNSVVFNCHPSAKGVSVWCTQLLNEAIVGAGGPANLLAAVANPTIESAQALMKHAGIRLLVVTGGPAVVKQAMGSGKKVIAAGPGNPPVVVDDTADLNRAARGIIKGASIDNNILCTAEKEVIVVDEVADALKKKLVEAGCIEVKGRDVARLEKIVCDAHGPNKKFVGKDASVILREIGAAASSECRLAIAEVDEAHPFVQHELLMPVLPIVRVKNVDDGIAMAKRVEHGFGHTAVMYSTDISALHRMARTINTSIFVKNDCNLAGLGLGGEGWTSFTIASPTGEGLTNARSFCRLRRCTLKEYFRIV